MNKIAVIIPYFGKFKPSFQLFYESCRQNPEIDWFIFTDNVEPENPSGNVKWISFTLEKFNALATEKTGITTNLSYPYKLCDFKPVYGAVFYDFIAGYEYWAYGDVDVIYGDILNCLEKINYKLYDKVNFTGHFCLMKNVSEMNFLFKEKIEGSKDFERIVNSGNVGFDEIDINIKALAKGKTIYTGICAADIVYEKGMQCVDKHIVKKPEQFGVKSFTLPKNFRHQLFVYENGKIFRYYNLKRKVCKDEFCYIHFRKEVPILFNGGLCDKFIICKQGFIDISETDLNEVGAFKTFADKYNYRGNYFQEKASALKFYVKKIFGVGKK